MVSPGNAESIGPETVCRLAPVAEGRAEAGWEVDERATAQDAICSSVRACWIVVRRLFVIVFAVPVPAPFPHVAVHVIKAPGIGFLLASGMSLALKSLSEPGIFRQVYLVVPEAVPSRTASPTGVFPLGLRG